MNRRPILVVGETPSLGRSIVDLLESWGLGSEFVYDVSVEGPLQDLWRRFPVVVVACNEPFCSTARLYARGEFPHVALVVVGSRDPAVLSMPDVKLLPLPLLPRPFVTLVSGLLPQAPQC
jgi:hypothetical protein